MSLLSVVRDVCAAVGVHTPTAVVPVVTTDRTMHEMLSLANEMAQRVAYDTREWNRLKVVGQFAGDGLADVNGVITGTTAFNLPDNFKRLLLTSNVWRSSSTQTPMVFVPDTDEWLIRRLRGVTHGLGEWAILGGQMHIFPTMPLGEIATYAYLDKNCIALNGGGFGDTFTNDADSFVLGDRLLKLGMIWQWKAHKGSPYTEDMGTFGDALVLAMGNDSPSPIIYGRGRMYGNMSYSESEAGWLS